MKHLVLNDVHIALGAKMVPFAGYSMPVQYTGVVKEHLAVRENVGLFDVSHMGEFVVSGKDALSFLQSVVANDVAKLKPGNIQYAYFPNEQGGIVDDLLVYCFSEEKYLLVVNAANIDKDWTHLNKYLSGEVTLKNLSDEYCLFALQGPNAIKVLQSLTPVDLSLIAYYNFSIGDVAETANVLISATGYTGAGGFELYVKQDAATAVFNSILKAGEKYDLQLCGLAARDTLRLEKAYCLYGNDIDDSTSPLAAGLMWVTKLTKDFVGKAAIELTKNNGVIQKLVGLELVDKGIPRRGYVLNNEQGECIGEITSGTAAPSLQKGIALAYVDKKYAQIGQTIFVVVRGKSLKAKVVQTPFI